jgi:hypothetical protein
MRPTRFSTAIPAGRRDPYEEDRQVLDRPARRPAMAPRGWTRLAPSELLDAVLRETAYASRCAGSRRGRRARTCKKLRGMIRRAQNRGYATLARIADHLEALAVGDESNAAIDAIDAVSLMTVHAAKGSSSRLFRRQHGARAPAAPRAPIRVTDDAAGRRRWRLPTISRKRTRTRRRAIARKPSACCTSRSRARATACICRRR